MLKPLLLLAGVLTSQGSLAQVRTSNEAFPIRPPAVSLPVAPLPVPVPAQTQVTDVIAKAPPAPVFDVSTKDRTVREAIARWARAAGWVHEPVHWSLDRDFPVVASAGAEVFGGEFRSAVRVLLASTELTDRPAQPCFYTNNVVRVIPKAEFCNKNAE